MRRILGRHLACCAVVSIHRSALQSLFRFTSLCVRLGIVGWIVIGAALTLLPTSHAQSAEGTEDESSSVSLATGPDLIESAVTNPPAAANAGTSFNVTDTVKNQGTADIGASETRYYLATDKVKNASVIPLSGGGRGVPALAVGQTSTGTLTVTIPAGTASGYYALLACADDTNLVAETNETNNCRAAALSVRVGTPKIVPGNSMAGYLAPPRNGHCNNRVPADVYVLTIATGMVAQISVTGKALDTYLCVLNQSSYVLAQDDDSGTGTNPLTAITLAAGSYSIEVASFSGVDKGSYTLTLKSLSIMPVNTISLGQTLVENLSTSAPKSQCYPYTPADRYQLTITVPTVVTIDVSSWKFNTYACLLDANNRTLTSDDNSGSGTNARVTYSIASPGTYYLEVTRAPGTSGTGIYRLSAQTGYPKAKPATVGPKVQGSLVGFEAEGKCYPYTPAVRYTFKITTPGTYTLDVGSLAFNTSACVLDSNLRAITSNDNSGPGSNSRIVYKYNTGTYYLEVTTAAGTSGAGLFTYQMHAGYPLPDLWMKLGDVTSKTLTSTMAEGTCSPYSPAYRIGLPISAATIVTIDVGSTTFDPYACLLDANLRPLIANDNSGPDNGARITYSITSPGTYYLQIMAAPGTSGSGAFKISVKPGYPPGLPIAIGQTPSGTLTGHEAETVCYPYTPAERYHFSVTTTKAVTVLATSTNFNTYLSLENGSDRCITSDDNSAGGTNAKISTTLNAGEYYIEVVAAPGTSGTGAFSLSLH